MLYHDKSTNHPFQSTVELLEIKYQSAVSESLQHFILMEEFYSTAVCISATNEKLRVTAFVRENFEISENVVRCSSTLDGANKNKVSKVSEEKLKKKESSKKTSVEENLQSHSESHNSSSDAQLQRTSYFLNIAIIIVACYLSVEFVTTV